MYCVELTSSTSTVVITDFQLVVRVVVLILPSSSNLLFCVLMVSLRTFHEFISTMVTQTSLTHTVTVQINTAGSTSFEQTVSACGKIDKIHSGHKVSL